MVVFTRCVHRFSFCSIRNNSVAVYEGLIDVRAKLQDGQPVSERQISSLIHRAGDVLTCGMCGKFIPRIDTNSWVLRCGHLCCKPTCWQNAGEKCPICPRN